MKVGIYVYKWTTTTTIGATHIILAKYFWIIIHFAQTVQCFVVIFER